MEPLNLKPIDILYIRENPDNLSAIELAEKFNVSRNSIYFIRKYVSDKLLVPSTINPLANRSKKLCDADVDYIRENPDRLTVKELSDKFNVCLGTIYFTISNKRNSHRGINRSAKNKKYRKPLKLTEKEVIFIKDNANKIPIEDLAEQFGVSKVTIYDIYSGRTWKDVGKSECDYKYFTGKLSEDDVKYIKSNIDKLTIKELAKKFNVNPSTIYRRIR